MAEEPSLSVHAVTMGRPPFFVFDGAITNFSQLCPEGSPQFRTLVSAPCKAPGGPSKVTENLEWCITMSGWDDYINCWLNLCAPNPNASCPQAQRLISPCQVTISFESSMGAESVSKKYAETTFSTMGSSSSFPKCTKISQLYRRRANLLVGDKLRFRIIVTPLHDLTTAPFVVVNAHQSSSQQQQQRQSSLKRKRVSPLNKLLGDLQRLFQPTSSKFSDVQLKCGSRSFHCHKVILAGRSSVFETMFGTGMAESVENVIRVEDMEPDVLAAILQYIYTGDPDLPVKQTDDWPAVIYGAEKYDLPELKNFCFDKMLDDLNLDNVGNLAVATHIYDADSEVRERVNQFVDRNCLTLMRKPEFKKILVGNPEAFFPVQSGAATTEGSGEASIRAVIRQPL